MKKFLKFIGYFLLLILVVVGIALWMLTQEKYQNMIAQKGTKYLSEKLRTKVEISKVKIGFFNHVNLQGVYVEDEQKDTLAYVGNLQLKTSELLSNYWKGETSVIHTVGLDDVYVNLNRVKDTNRWNYDFILEAFDSPATDTISPKKKSSTSASNPKIDIKNLTCNRIRFVMNDNWRGEDMRYAFDKLNLDVNQFSLDKKNIDIEQLLIDKANIFVKEYKGGKPKDLTPDDTTLWGTPFNPELFKINITKLKLEHSNFIYEDGDSKPKKNEFDERHLGITDLNIFLNNTIINDDTLNTQIENLTAQERCGLKIVGLQANAKISQTQSFLTNLTLKTNHSILKNHYEMNYKNFHDFEDYISKVNMRAHITGTNISSIDIGYFANILNQYPIAVNMAGDIDGTVKHLSGKNLNIAASKTSFKGDMLVTGLPDIDKTFFDVKAKELLTSGNDLNRLIPQTKVDAVAWNDLKQIKFSGTYKGKVDQFNAAGNLNTTLGNAIVDLDMNFKHKVATYNGILSTDNFNLGRLLKQKTLGYITMNGKIDGRGFDMNDLDAKVNATVRKIEIEGKSYSDLTINGLVSKKKFDGIFVSQDPNLALNFDGKLDLSGKQPSYNFNSRFLKFDLQKMGITKQKIVGSGMAQLNFSGDNIDNFLGTAVLKNISLEVDGKNLYFDIVSLSSEKIGNQKQILLNSSIADAQLKGNFNVSQLPDAIQIYLHNYLPQYIKRPISYQPQSFNYNVQIKNAATILDAFIPELSGLDNTLFSGELNTVAKIFNLDAIVPSVGYREFQIDSLQIVGAGNFESLDLNAVSQQFYYNNEVVIPSMQLNTSMANDTANLTINTQSINSILGEASINCKATANGGNLYVNVLPSNININELTWNFNSENQLIFGKDIVIKDFNIETGPQKIVVNTRNETTSDLLIDLENIDLENISQMIQPDGPAFLGHVNGIIEVADFKNKPIVDAKIATSDELRIDQDTVGVVTANVIYNVNEKKLMIDKSTSVMHFSSFAFIEGYVNANDSTIDISTSMEKVNISFINQFLSDYIQNMRGEASGKVFVKGSLSKPNITGSVNLSDASLKVLFLGTTYGIDDAKFRFNNSKIEMDNIVFHDERNKNYTGLLKGYISHQNFTNFFLNFSASSDNLLCLNTNDIDDPLFYGYVPAKIDAKLTGEMDDVYVDIDAKPLKGAQFHLPINSSGDASTYDFIKFAELGRDQNLLNIKKKKPSYVNLKMNIDGTPDAEVFIILDKNTGEEIQAKGNGAITLNVDLGNSVEMFGSYIITEGKYKFNFRGLFQKDFIIDEGSKITWTGDPLAATMRVNAIYKVPSPLSLYPLASAELNALDNSDPDVVEAKKTYATFISLMLTGSLSTPDIKFDITQPENKATGSLAYGKLEQIKNDEQELVSQTGVLLLLGNFKASSGGIAGKSYEQGAISSASDVITSALSGELNNQFQNLTKWKNISLNLDHQTLNSGVTENQLSRDQFSLNVSANLLNNRVVVDASNSVDVGKANNGASTSNFSGDYRAAYLITKDGRLRVNAYRSANVDIEGGNLIKNGLGLSYKKVFDNFADLFSIKKRRKPLVLDSLKTHS